MFLGVPGFYSNCVCYCSVHNLITYPSTFDNMAYWTSKLGNKYLKATIDEDEGASKARLDQMRRMPTNRRCADCGLEPTVWASVNLGVFLCIRCGSLHRGIGTHISVPKGCTGT
jgi:hypothetical protein